MTSFEHTPIMVAEVLTALRPRAGQCFADGTVGGGGHAEAILQAIVPGGRLCGCDRDAAAVSAANHRLAGFAGSFEIRHGRFAELATWVPLAACDGAILDLGVSSPQLDRPERGFSFQRNGPLDMRMDEGQTTTAAQLVNDASPEELARIFHDLGDERQARRIARAIDLERQARRIETTRHLAGLIERLVPGHHHRTHPATRVFQALRLAVNQELEELTAGLLAVWSLLKPGGRLVVLTFHSLEVHIVRDFGRKLARDYEVDGEIDIPEWRRPKTPQLRWVPRKAIQPSPTEISVNPRSRSAQLRVMEKI